jgi:hypothetical protein
MRTTKLLLSPVVYSFGIASLAICVAHATSLGNQAFLYGLLAGLLNSGLDVVPRLREPDGDVLSWGYVLSSFLGGVTGLGTFSLLLSSTRSNLVESVIVLVLAVAVRMLIRFGYARTRKSVPVVR